MTFHVTPNGKSIQYHLKSALLAEIAEFLIADVKKRIEADSGLSIVVFDMQNFDVDNAAFKAMTSFGLQLRKDQKQIYILSQSKDVHAHIKSEGVENIFKPIFSLADAGVGAQVAGAQPKIDVNFLTPFVTGTIEVLKVQCHTEAKPLKPFLKSKDQEKFVMDIAGIIGIVSPQFRGSIAIGFPEKVFLHLMSSMLGEEFKTIDTDLEDGAGELLNMIFGHAKKVLNENGFTFEKALPTVVRAANLSLSHSNTQGTLVLPFSCADGVFRMEIGTEQSFEKKEI